MIWIVKIAIFVIGVFCGLLLFAWLEKELFTKLLLLKAEIIYCIKKECEGMKLTKSKVESRNKKKKR
jgi:hypothetical protein